MTDNEKWCPQCQRTRGGSFCCECRGTLCEKEVKKWCPRCRVAREGKFCCDCTADLHENRSPKVKGHCFILNNFEFSAEKDIAGYALGENRNLPGYKKDAEKIKKTFKALNFAVKEEKNATAENMIETVKKWCGEMEVIDIECVVVFILSHGDEHGTLYGHDGKKIHVDDIISKFSSSEKLKGKHKLFFVQACRGDLNPPIQKSTIPPTDNEFTPAGVRFDRNSKFHETFVYYSTGEGYYSFVSKEGSIFIGPLCEVLEKYGGQCGLWELVTIVNEKVSETVIEHKNNKAAQCPEAVYTLDTNFLFGEDSNVTSAVMKLGRVELTKRNPCYVITNTKCGTHEAQCECFEEDRDKAVKTFTDLNFEVYQKDNLTRDEITTLFSDVNKVQNFTEAECLVCVIFSCGGLNGSKPIVYGTDGVFYSVDTMTRKVMGTKGLINKPKLFIMVLNTCSKELYNSKNKYYSAGPERNEDEVIKSQGADTFVYYVILKDEKQQSRFITTLSKVLLDYSGKRQHLGDVVFKVNERMRKFGEIPEACSTLTSLVYITPLDTKDENVGEHIAPAGYLSGQYQPESSDRDETDYQNEEGVTVVLTMDKNDTDRSYVGESSQVLENADVTQDDPTENVSREISGLSHDEKKEIAEKLDSICDTINWRDFGLVVAEKYGKEMDLKKDEVENVHLAYYGGGSPAKNFMNKLTTKKPYYELSQLSLLATTLDRNDISTVIQGWPEVSVLNDVTQRQLKSLASLLDKNVVGGRNWRDFANKLDFSNREIASIELSAVSSKNCSPTCTLLDLIAQKRPEFELCNLREVAKYIGRNDVAKIFDTFIQSREEPRTDDKKWTDRK